MPVYIIVKDIRTMDMTIDQQVALDEALVPHASRLRIGKSNFRLRSDITSKELTLQLVYDVMRLTPFYKAFLVTSNVLEIYMQEFWATVQFIITQYTFDELSFEEEILAFLRYLGHIGEIRKITDVNINKLHQPWRSFAVVINKCLSGKSTCYDSLRLSQAHILWGMYHKKNIDFAYLLWKTLYIKLSTKMPRRAIICTIPAYKEYHAIASRAAPPKTKASVRKMQSSSDTIMPPPTAASTRLSTSVKGKQPAKSSKAKGNDDASLGMNVGGEEGQDVEDDDEELYRDVNINLEGRDSSSVSSQFVTSMLNPSPDADIDSLFESTLGVDVQASTIVAPLTLTAPTLPPLTIPTISQVPQAPTPPTTAPRTFLHDLLNFGSLLGFDHRLKNLEANFSEFVQKNQFAGAISFIPGIFERYMDQRMNKAVKIAVQIQSDRLRDEAQAKNEEFLNNLDGNIQNIIKEQVKEQVKVQVFKILAKIEKTVNEQLEAEVLTRSSNSSKTSYAVAADISEMELKKILIEKMVSNKSIHRSDEQWNLYKALVDAYECDQIILDTYGDTITLKRRRNDADKDEELSAGSNRRSKRRKEGKEPYDLAKQAQSRSSFNELMDTHVDFSAFLMNRLKVDTLTLELLAGLTYELMKGSCKSLVELELFLEEVYKATTDQLDWNNRNGQQYPHNLFKPLPRIPNCRGHRVILFDHFINNDLEYLRGGASSRKYTTSVTKIKAANYGHIKWIEDLFYGFAVNRESAHDVYSKRRIIAVTKLHIVEWHNYKHLDWITVRRDDDKLYKFKEGDFKRLHIQDIEDMLLLLVQGKLTNLMVEERFAFNVSLRMFTRSIVIQRRMEDLQLGVESYQKKLNLTKPDTDGTLNDVRTALDDRLKGIRMKHLPQAIWRRSDKERAATMIQAIDKQLKTRRIMRSQEKFV
nr:hypothetical protein [Tanacetum cinerariifolium]